MGEAKRKKEQFKKQPRTCVFCGARDATTDDHVPPKGIFAKPRPQLITVPACDTCNGGASQLDENFKVFLSIAIGDATTTETQSFKNSAFRSIKANMRLRRELLSGPKVYARTPAGAIRETRLVRWDAPSHDLTIEKIARGLYWHHFQERLPADAKVETFFFAELDDDLLKIAMSIERRNVGGDNKFVYAYCRVDGDPYVSLWLFQFYGGHWAGAFTTPAGHSLAAEDDGSIALKTAIAALRSKKQAEPRPEADTTPPTAR